MANLTFKIDIRAESPEEAQAYFEALKDQGVQVDFTHRRVLLDGETSEVWFINVESDAARASYEQLMSAVEQITKLHGTHPITSEW